MKTAFVMIALSFALAGAIFSQDMSDEIKPATCFSWDLKYTGYSLFQNIKVSNYYDVNEVIQVNINDDGKEDYLILLVPKSITAPLDEDFDMGKFYRRTLVEIISFGEKYRIGKSYTTLVSNITGLGIGFGGIKKIKEDIVITHSKPNGNLCWDISMRFRYDNGELYLYKIEQNTIDGEFKSQDVGKVFAQNVNIFKECEFDID